MKFNIFYGITYNHDLHRGIQGNNQGVSQTISTDIYNILPI